MSSKANYFFKNLFRYSFLLLDFIIFVWWHLLLSQSISHGWSCNNSGIFRTIQKLSVWSRYCAGQAESWTKKISVLFASFLKGAKRRFWWKIELFFFPPPFRAGASGKRATLFVWISDGTYWLYARKFLLQGDCQHHILPHPAVGHLLLIPIRRRH